MDSKLKTRAWLGMCVVVGLLAACEGPRRTRGDGGLGGDGGQGGGGGGGASDGGMGGGGGGPTFCTPGDLYCDNTTVRECDPTGKPGPAVESCPEACSFGRCTSSICSEAESKQSVEGCLFYAVDTDSTSYDDKQIFGFPVGNVGDEPVNVTVQRKIGPDSWKDMMMATVEPGAIHYMRLAIGPAMGDDWHIEGTGQEHKAYRIESEGPIVVYTDNADDENGASANSGATLVLPVHALGRHHFIIAPPERGVASGGGFGGGGPDHAFMAIVAVRDNTKVTVTAKGNVAAGGVIDAMAIDETRDFFIDQGEVLQLETGEKGNDLTGSEVVSDKPVAIFAGNTCGGFDPTRLSDCDHIEEMMYPVTQWGHSFAVLDLRMPETGPSENIWVRVVASEDDTELTFDAPRALSGLPSDATLQKGEFLHIDIHDPLGYGSTELKRAHFRLESTKPVMVESFMGVQEGAAVMIPVDQFLDSYLISAHPWFQGFLIVTRSAGEPVTLDDMPMSDKLFAPAGGGYEASYVSLTRCDATPTKCGHRIVGKKIGVTITANGGVCNYCYAGGAGARCVNKTAGCR